MTVQNLPYVLPLIAAAAICATLAVYAVRQSVPGSRPAAGIMLLAALWSLAYACELASTNLDAAAFWSSVQWPGVVTAPTLWLLLVLEYTGQTRWLSIRNKLLLAIVPLATLALALTNRSHGLLIASISFDPRDGLPVEKPGAWYWVYTGYAYLILTLSLIPLARMFRRSQLFYRLQIGALLAGAGIPWVADIAGNSGLTPLDPNLNLVPFGFIVSGFAFAWGLFRLRLLDIVPVARDTVIETMANGVIVLDGAQRVVDLNPAAQQALGRIAHEVIGRPAAEAWPAARALLLGGSGTFEIRSEHGAHGDLSERCYDVRIAPWADKQGRAEGSIISIYDITERKLSEQQLLQRNRELSTLNEIGRLLNKLVEPAEIYELIYTMVGRVLDNRNFLIAIYAEADQLLSFPILTRNGQRLESPSRVFANSLTEHVIRTKEPLLISANFEQRAAELGLQLTRDTRPKSIAIVPMIANDRVVGVVSVNDYEREHVHNAHHIELLSTIAAQASIALVNAQLFAETQLLARTDGLTQVANRRYLTELGERELNRARRFGHPLSALMIDIDHFKDVNDQYGHAQGDRVLRLLVACCQEMIRDVDTLGRYGGEEFVILLTETNAAGAYRLAERLVANVAQMAIETDQSKISVTVSIGVAAADLAHDDLEALIARADNALYAAKRAGRNRVELAGR
jgi:diguanylate cyclase (GGDEF)-like protein/PAS domain S-box-containing protein